MAGDENDRHVNVGSCQILLNFEATLFRQPHIEHQAARSVWNAIFQECIPRCVEPNLQSKGLQQLFQAWPGMKHQRQLRRRFLSGYAGRPAAPCKILRTNVTKLLNLDK